MWELDDILEKCIKGDRYAAEKLYKMFSAKMFALCLRYSQDRAEAEDNFQDGFIRVYESLRQYSGKGSFEGWMKRIFMNTAIEKHRKRRFFETKEDIPEIEEETEDEGNVPPEILRRFVKELPERYKLVFNLYAIENMSHKEIAAFAGISEGTSKSNLARAREILKRKIKNYLENEG